MKQTTHLVWKALFTPAIEYCKVISSAELIIVESYITGMRDVSPFHTTYELTLDAHWQIRHVAIMLSGEINNTIILKTDGKGTWMNEKDETLHGFDGCYDIDISITPFTNTLPVKRLQLEQGASKEISVLYIDLPSGSLKAVPQQYTYLGDNRYKYENLDSAFTATILFTDDGYVQYYPDLFELIHRQ